jgi:Na+/proline symporter
VIAGLFAAAMSTLDSSLNSVATTLTTDFYQRLNPNATDRQSLRLAKAFTLGLGLLGTGSALYMARLRDTSMMDQNLKVLGLFGGGLAGMFAAGMLSRRITTAGALAGFLASGAVLAVVENSGRVNFLLYTAVGVVTCVAVSAAVTAAQSVASRSGSR